MFPFQFVSEQVMNLLRGFITSLLVFGLSLLAPWSCHARAVSSKGEVTYAILIDGGTTGSKMFIYKIKLNQKGKVDEVSDLEEMRNSLGKVKPGLSSFLDKPEKIPYYLKKFIHEAKKIVPEEKFGSTPILILATAGMRLLTKPDQEVIMNKVSTRLSMNQIVTGFISCIFENSSTWSIHKR